MRALVTVGPTREPIDDVRYITNRSSGRMGHAVAEALIRRGHETVLVTGPVALVPPAGAEVVAVETAEEMHREVMARFREADALIMVAAVADYRPERHVPGKIKKGDGTWTLRLVPTRDILAEAGRLKGAGQVLVGFALDAIDPLADGRRKMAAKHLDLVVANGPEALEAEATDATILSASGEVHPLGTRGKREIAEALVPLIEKALRDRAAPPPPPAS